ncbi:hypothetical protein DNTS_016513 [Danionella cerebrum]|uniref:Uncharacterized protein n=1 Tax=Danionella cerebrum TaxID=2873325 RepID=A0A553MR61_9TELE|nr:hypothetical protein DNTS_016513 [Danionella translucida]
MVAHWEHSSTTMRKRTVVMYLEIGCFVSCLCGWVLICSTLATEYWIVSESAAVVLTAGDFYSNLWMDCISDTTGVSDCKYYPSMMNLSAFLHVSRALAIVSVIFGFWGNVLALIGMKCTKIGGTELINARLTFSATLTYMASGLSGMTVYSWWGEKTRSEFLDPYYLEIKFELGAALFVGWGGSCLLICGSAVLGYLSGREAFPKRYTPQPRKAPTYMTAQTRRSYLLPGSSRPTAILMSTSQRSLSGSRLSRARAGIQESRPVPPSQRSFAVSRGGTGARMIQSVPPSHWSLSESRLNPGFGGSQDVQSALFAPSFNVSREMTGAQEAQGFVQPAWPPIDSAV